MIQDSEVLLFILATGIFFSIAMNRKRIMTLPYYRLLVAGYYLLYVGWGLTILEGFFLGDVLNLAEHVCYAFSMICITLWVVTMCRSKECQ